MDVANNTVRYEEDSKEQRMVASLVKVALACRTLKNVESDELSLGGEQKYLESGDGMSLVYLPYAMMAVSGKRDEITLSLLRCVLWV